MNNYPYVKQYYVKGCHHIFTIKKSVYLNLMYLILSNERILSFLKILRDTSFCDFKPQPSMEKARKQHIANNQWSCVNLIFITLKSLFLRNWFSHMFLSSSFHGRLGCQIRKSLYPSIFFKMGVPFQERNEVQ